MHWPAQWTRKIFENLDIDTDIIHPQLLTIISFYTDNPNLARIATIFLFIFTPNSTSTLTHFILFLLCINPNLFNSIFMHNGFTKQLKIKCKFHQCGTYPIFRCHSSFVNAWKFGIWVITFSNLGMFTWNFGQPFGIRIHHAHPSVHQGNLNRQNQAIVMNVFT